ncbi:MAG: hypothetical protein AAFN74_19015 [Myxococcota bacterium]
MVDEALRGPAFLSGGTAPMLLERFDSRFMHNIRDDLASRARWPELKKSIVRARNDGTLKLYQPIHRAHTVALVEAFCRIPGQPRVDRAKIESAGIVLRRVAEGGRRQRWVTHADGERQWELLTQLTQDEDPDPARRRKPSQGLPELDRRLHALKGKSAAAAESFDDMYPMGANVEDETERTLLVGLVSTATQEASASTPSPSFSAQDIQDDGFPTYLQANPPEIMIPSAGDALRREDVASRTDVQTYASFLNKLVIAYDYKGTGPAARALRERLASLEVTFADDHVESLVTHLDRAADILVFGRPGTVTMPVAWPAISSTKEAELVDAVGRTLEARHTQLSKEQDRFGDDDARYVVRAFMRIDVDPKCPPVLVWSKESSPFRIAPWHETSPAPATVVPLPDPTQDPSAFTPNVVFDVPAGIADLLKANAPDKFIEGDLKSGPGFGIGWLCALNLPIITLCAFIVLFIFLSLFNLFFWWLPFVRICLPIPKRG